MDSWLVGVLRAAWLAGILPLAIASIPSSRLNSFHGALLGFAKRGKILQSSSYNFTVPQRFFCHFYVVAVVWTTLLLSVIWIYPFKTAPSASESLLYSTLASHLTRGSHFFSFHKSHLTPLELRHSVWRSVFLLLLMEIQVLRRLIETIYVFKYRPSARMHIFGYITGLLFYTAAPLSLCCTLAPEVFRFAADQVAEFIIKGRCHMPALQLDWWESVNPLMKLGWYQWIGAAIFLWGSMHQRRCHAILVLQLYGRKRIQSENPYMLFYNVIQYIIPLSGLSAEHAEQVDEYIIPRGDWFEIVSSPHYLAEIVIYAALVVTSGGSDLTVWLVFGFVVANLVFAAAETQRWYHHKFDNYPSNRFAIIPYVY